MYYKTRPYPWVVTLDSNACPADPEAVDEAYIMGTLSKDQATTFEEHKS
jgi:hypothetical protein